MNRFAMRVFMLAMFAVFGCGDRDPGRITGPDNEPAYRLAPLPPHNAVLQLMDITGRALTGRAKVDGYLRETQVIGGVSTLVETRFATATAEADAAYKFFVPEIPGDGTGNGVVDFNDFFLFADSFGLWEESEAFNPNFDMDGNGVVDLTDFFLFADNFGRRSPRAAGKSAAIASPVSYEDAPRGRMDEKSFRAAWDVLYERLNNPEPAGKALQAPEPPEYRFHAQSVETPPEFEAFDIIITGSFPAHGELPREIVATPAGPVTSITRTLFITPQDTTIAYGESAAARGILTVLYDGVPILVQSVEPVPASRDTVANADGTSRVTARFSYEDLTAAQTITVLAPPPSPDTEAPVVNLQFLDGNATVTISADDDLAATLSVSIVSAGDTVISAAVHQSGTSVLYPTGLAYDHLTSWKAQAFQVLVSDGVNTAALDTMVTRQDVDSPEVSMGDVSISPEGQLTIESVSVFDSLSGIPRSGNTIMVLVRFPGGAIATGGLSSFSREPDGRLNGTVNSVFVSPNTGEPRDVAVIVRAADEAGNMAEISTTVRQGTHTAPSPPPAPPPEPEPEPTPEPDPTPIALHNIVARANGLEPGSSIITSFGSLIFVTVSASGTPAPTYAWTMGDTTLTSASGTINAVSGLLRLHMVNTVSDTTLTWPVIALTAP